MSYLPIVFFCSSIVTVSEFLHKSRRRCVLFSCVVQTSCNGVPSFLFISIFTQSSPPKTRVRLLAHHHPPIPSRGFGFVTFSKCKSCRSACSTPVKVHPPPYRICSHLTFSFFLLLFKPFYRDTDCNSACFPLRWASSPPLFSLSSTHCLVMVPPVPPGGD